MTLISDGQLENPLIEARETADRFHQVDEFDGTIVSRLVWNGLANIDEFDADGPGARIQGLTLRSYNPESHQWSLYWASCNPSWASRDGYSDGALDEGLAHPGHGELSAPRPESRLLVELRACYVDVLRYFQVAVVDSWRRIPALDSLATLSVDGFRGKVLHRDCLRLPCLLLTHTGLPFFNFFLFQPRTANSLC